MSGNLTKAVVIIVIITVFEHRTVVKSDKLYTIKVIVSDFFLVGVVTLVSYADLPVPFIKKNEIKIKLLTIENLKLY